MYTTSRQQPQEQSIRGIQPALAVAPLQARTGAITEVRMVATTYGPAKVYEVGVTGRKLQLQRLPPMVRYVPFVQEGLLGGAFVIAPDRAQAVDAIIVRYPVVATVPYLFLSEAARREIASQLKQVGIQLRLPDEIDLTASVKGGLSSSWVVARNAGAHDFDLMRFVERIRSVRSSPELSQVFLIETEAGARYILSVDQTLEEILKLHSFFTAVRRSAAVKLAYGRSQNSWIAPLQEPTVC